MIEAVVVGCALVAMVTIVFHFVAKMRIAGNVTFQDLRKISTEFNERAVEYMRANYSGDPSHLESAVRGLLPIARDMAKQMSPTFDDEILQTMIVTTIANNRIAPRDRVAAALESVIRAEKAAA
jgi:hypothetical protein